MNIQDAARYSGMSEKTLRRRIKDAVLPATLIGGRYDIQMSDLDAICIVPPTPDTIGLRILDLERRVSDIEAILAQMSNNTHAARKQPQRLIHPQNEASASNILPDGWIPLNDLLKQHNLTSKRNAVIRYMERQGKLHRGDWTLSGHAVNLALDESGVEEFERRYVK